MTQVAATRETSAPVLAAVVALLALGIVWPSGAYAASGLVLWLGAIGLVAVSGMHLPSFGTSRTAGAALACLSIYTVLTVAGLAWSPVPALGRGRAATVLLGAAFLVVAFVAARRDSPRGVCIALAAVLSAEALFGLYQVVGPAWMPRTFAAMERGILAMPPDEPMRDALLHAIREGRAAGTVGAANIFASLCLFGACAAGALAASIRGIAPRALAAAGALACVAALVASGSNGGAVALAGAAALLAVLLLAWRMSRRGILLASAAAAVLVLALVAVVVVVALYFPTTNQRWLGRTGLTQRANYWVTAWAIWSERPLLGAGPGAFEILYPRHRLPGANETRFAHSWLFESGVATGFAGLAAFMGFVGAVAAAAVRRLARLRATGNHPQFAAVAGLAAGTAGLVAHGLIEYTLSFAEGWLLLMIACGVLLADHTMGEGRGRAPLLASAGLALLLLAPYWLLHGIPARGEAEREYATGLFRMNGDPREAMLAASAAIDADPRHPEGHALRGHFRQMMGDGGARADYERAIALNPHSARYREILASWFAAQGDFDSALRGQQAARALHPLDAGHALTLADLQLRAGDRDAATATLCEALELKSTTVAEYQLRRRLAAELGVALPGDP